MSQKKVEVQTNETGNMVCVVYHQQKKYAQIEKEILAIAFGVKIFEKYVFSE